MREVSVAKLGALGGVGAAFESPADGGAVEPPASGERLRARARRPRSIRARTVSVKRMPKRELELGRLLYPLDEHADVPRPRTRADCQGGARPCPFVSCVHHLYLDVSAKTGAIKLNFPDLEPDELPHSCILDVVDSHPDGITLEQTGAVMNLTRERVRQIEVRAMAKAMALAELAELRDHAAVGGRPKRRLPILSADDAACDEVDAERFASDELDEDDSAA